MEKWAQSMNKKKDVTKKPTPQVSQTSASSSVTPSRPASSSSSTAATASTTPATSVASGFVAIESKKSADTSPQSLEAKKVYTPKASECLLNVLLKKKTSETCIIAYNIYIYISKYVCSVYS